MQTGVTVPQEVSLGEPARVASVLRGTGNLGEGRGALVAASAPGELPAKGRREPRAPESCLRLPGAATSRGTQAAPRTVVQPPPLFPPHSRVTLSRLLQLPLSSTFLGFLVRSSEQQSVTARILRTAAPTRLQVCSHANLRR